MRSLPATSASRVAVHDSTNLIEHNGERTVLVARRNFKREVREAVCSPQLALALDRATSMFAAKRAEAYAGINFKAVQSEIRAIKAQAIARLPDLVAQFKEEAEKAGAVVYDPVDAEGAALQVLGIIQARGAQRAVKSKSMLTEEIGLNRVLGAAGIDVVETDLGEWIIQLAGERPSHFVGPAIHKTREEIAALFSRTLGREIPPDPETLVQVARQQLRQAFISADVGISGANIAIADTGTLVIVTNEGNARLVTTLPPIHIAVVGIEKIVPDLMSAATILKYLPKSAAGQKITSYVSFITGPSRTADIEMTLTTGVHGPKELHIVLVDNGRERLRADDEFREALHCVKCGACLNVCPVFRIVGGHVFGHVYNGGIGAVLTAFLHGMNEAVDPLQLCTTCHRCVDVCTSGIDIPRLVVALRRRAVEQRGLSTMDHLVFRSVLADPERLQTVLGIARKAQAMVGGKGEMIGRLPLFLSSLTSFRSLPKLAKVPFRERWPQYSPGAAIHQSKQSRLDNDRNAAANAAEDAPSEGQSDSTWRTWRPHVAFFAGCMIDFVYPEIGEAVTRILQRRGIVLSFPLEQGCCGLPATYAGDVDTGRALAMRTVEAMESARADYVVAACPTCTFALRKEFPRLLSDDGDWEPRAKKLAEKTYDFSEFLIRFGPRGSYRRRGSNARRMKVTYQDSCHLRFGLDIHAEPRRLIATSGNELVEMERPDACCGCAGIFSLKFPDVSKAMLGRMLENISATGAEAVVTGCPACLLQLGGGLHKRRSEIKALHVAQLLDR